MREHAAVLERKNAELELLASTDALTGLLNRRALMTHLTPSLDEGGARASAG